MLGLFKQRSYGEWIICVCRCVLGCLFLIAAYSKYTDPFVFGQQIMSYALPLPYALVDLLVWIVPGLETVLGVCLLLNIQIKKTAWITTLVLCGFTLLILMAMFRGLEIDCGCFGTTQPIGWLKILENGLLIAMGILIVFFEQKRTPERYRTHKETI